MVIHQLVYIFLISMATAFVSKAVPSKNGELSLDRLVLDGHVSTENLPPMQIKKKRVVEKQEPSSSVVFPQLNPHLEAWSKLSSEVLNHPDGAIRFEHEFNPKDSFLDVAEQMARDIKSCFEDDDSNNERSQDILSGIQTFDSFCKKHMDGKIKEYHLKVSVMHGRTATQCPFWHVDNVPVRYMQTFLGPGSMYIDPKIYYNGVHDRIINNDPPSGMAHLRNWKEHMVKASGIEPGQAKLGQAAMLVGFRWPDFARKLDLNRVPVIHRSPLDVKDGRVLMVLDVKLEEELCDKGCCSNKSQ